MRISGCLRYMERGCHAGPACPEVQNKHQVSVIQEDKVDNKEGARKVHSRSGREAHGHVGNEGQGNCLALVLRSEGLAALPLIATSVTRDCQR